MTTIRADLKAAKAELLERKLELEEKLAQMSRERFSDDQVQDPGDQTLTSTMESLHLSLQDAQLQEYHRIVRALEKINDGTYGLCSDCGSEISPKRLKSYPNASRCLACQEAFEEASS